MCVYGRVLTLTYHLLGFFYYANSNVGFVKKVYEFIGEKKEGWLSCKEQKCVR